MTLFERKAIDWLKSVDNPRTPTDEGYYAKLILAMFEELGEEIEYLESKVEYLQDVLDNADISYLEEV